MLRLVFQPLFQLSQRNRPVADAILLLFVHLCEGLALVLEDRIPAFTRSLVWWLAPDNRNVPKLVGPRAGTILPCTLSVIPEFQSHKGAQ